MCAHDIRGNSSHLQLSTWPKLVIETEKPPRSLPPVLVGLSPLLVFRKSWALQLPAYSRDSTLHLTHRTFTCATRSFVPYTALWLTCSLPGTRSAGPAMHCYWCALPNGPVASSWGSCLETPVYSHWPWRDTKGSHGWTGQFLHKGAGTSAGGLCALGWHEWAVDMGLTSPLKRSEGPTAYGDSGQWAGQ